MATKKGIDVSVWNGNIDWAKASKEIDFAILRAGYGRSATQKDKQFENNYNGCKANKIPCGVYWYNYATTVADAQSEARTCLEILKGKTFDYPVWYDIEESNVLGTGRNNVTAIAKAFLEIIAAAGYKTGIYASKSALENYFTDEVKNKYDIWVAHVGNGGATLSSTSYKGHVMWQYSWKGKIAGINGDVDMDYCYKEYVTAQTPTTPAPSVTTKPTTPATEKIDVIYRAYAGKWYNDITNCNDVNDMGYAGVDGKGISGFAAKVTKGTLKYRVHTKNGKWLGWITKYDLNDWNFGIAGIKGQLIDGIQFDFSGVEGYNVKYRVSTTNSKGYLSWITGWGSGDFGYAGIYGQVIDKVQVKIEKV